MKVNLYIKDLNFFPSSDISVNIAKYAVHRFEKSGAGGGYSKSHWR